MVSVIMVLVYTGIDSVLKDFLVKMVLGFFMANCLTGDLRLWVACPPWGSF